MGRTLPIVLEKTPCHYEGVHAQVRIDPGSRDDSNR